MLKRRPIRVKLIVALTLLSAIVVLLAFSGFWGLYSYERLANAVSRRAVEIPLANDLHLVASTLRESYGRRVELRDHEGGMMERPLGQQLFDVDSLQTLEKRRFEHALTGFELDIDTYQTKLQAAVQEQPLLVDNTQQQRSLREIQQLFTSIKDRYETLQIDSAQSLSDDLDRLVVKTAEHLEIIQGGMRDFSHDVRGQYNKWIVMAWACAVLALTMVAILLLSFRSLVLKPFRTLLDGSRLVAGGQFDHRIDLGTGDELSELAEAMNEMTDRFQGALQQVNAYCTDLDRQVQQRTREVIQNEQLASVGFLSAGVAHEINNPLASIAWSAESLQSRMSDLSVMSSDQRIINDELCESLTTNLRRIEDEAYRCKGITEKLLDFSRLSEVRRVPTDLSELVQDVVAMVGKVGKYRCKTLRTHVEPSVTASVNPQEIRQVVLNLVTNALESVDCDGAVDVNVRTVQNAAAIVVKDDGCGMSSEVLRHLFEPFFTRRRDGTGTGLGLSITYRIVSHHGGSLIASSDGEGCGSQMEMLLPLTPNDDQADQQTRPLITSASAGNTSTHENESQ